MWLYFAFFSALLLGIYEVCKKSALSGNAIIPVLFLNTLFGSLIFVPFVFLSYCFPETLKGSLFFVPPLSFAAQSLIFIKAMIVLISWIFAYYATKYLPLTIIGPIKSCQPVVVLFGAFVFFGERLNLFQWMGVVLSVLSFFMLSISGKKEGIDFRGNKWILFLVLSILFGAASGLYDNFLMKRMDVMSVQVWFNFYQLLIMTFVLLLIWFPVRRRTAPFKWRWSILAIPAFLAVADFIYFYALTFPDSMISIVSMVRRSNVLVTFVAGALIYKEKNLKNKAIDLILVLLGMFFLYLGTK